MKAACARLARQLGRDRRGGVAIMMAGSMTAMLAATAFAVDMGSIYLANRKLQGAADAAALAAIDMPTATSSAVQQAITANNLANAQIAGIVPGTYTPDGSVPADQRFVPATPVPNAVRVTLTQSVPLFFGRIITGRGTTRIQATATAARVDYAAFSIGTRLAALQGGLPNLLLSKLAGTDLNLSVADYNALVGTQINLLSFSDALATQLHLTGVSYSDTLDAQATLPQILSALAEAAGSSAAAGTLRGLALKVPPTTVQLSDLIDLGPYGGQDHGDPTTAISADGYSILRETLQLANGSRQVTADLGLNLPGLTSTSLTLAMGQRPEHSPWLTVAQDGSVIVRTAQGRLYFNSAVANTLGISVNLPLYTELAEAQARLASISCQGGGKATVGLTALPSVGSVAIAAIDPTKLSSFNKPLTEQPATIATVSPLIKLTSYVHLDLGGAAPNWQPVTFTPDDIAAGTIHTVSTGDLTQGVASSLVSKVQLTPVVLGLPINLSGITSAVGALLTPLGPTLDGVIDQVTDLLGVHVGQADLQVDGVRCGKPSLVA